MSEGSHTTTATVEVLTAEVRVLMVGSRQVTLSVYRQLDRRPSRLVRPFGRVSDKQDEQSYRCRSVFVVGCEIETGALVRSEHFVPKDGPTRLKKLVDRRGPTRRAYVNDQRKSVEPFAEERRVGERRENRQRRAARSDGVWFWDETEHDYQERLSAWHEDGSKYEAWTELPLIVLAGLR